MTRWLMCSHSLGPWSLLNKVACFVGRCGILLAIRALKTQQVTGICITASHNPAEDNGVKLVEPNGEMLCQDWEVRLRTAVSNS